MTVRQGHRNFSADQIGALSSAFAQGKAEQDKLLELAPTSIFVHTEAYQACKSRTKSLLVGRKGVGKSALIRTFVTLDGPTFSEVVSLQADDAMFDRICTLVVDAATRLRDMRVSADRVAMATWYRAIAGFGLLCGCRTLLRDGNGLSDGETVILTETQTALLADVTDELSHDADYNRLFHSFVDKRLMSLIDLTDRLTQAERVREVFQLLPPSVDPALEILNKHGYRLLLTLDEFDDFVDTFLRHTSASTRRQALLDLFKGLVLSVRRLERRARFEWLNLIIALPQDKFLELILRERAAIEGMTSMIHWRVGELLEFVEKRISYVLGQKTKWSDIFDFPIANGNPNVQVKEDSFIYLVRHTSRKPRELMLMVRGLFTLMVREQRSLTEEDVRRVVKEANEKLVEDHFIPEYLPEYPTLTDLLARLRSAGVSTVMSYSDMTPYVMNWRPWGGDEALNGPEALLRLFQMGIIGVREESDIELYRSVRQNGQSIVYHFSFSGTSAIEFAGMVHEMSLRESKDQRSRSQLIFSPMFFEYMRLRHLVNYVVNQLG